MRRAFRALALTSLLFALSAAVSAEGGGAGGILLGVQRPDLAPDFLPARGATTDLESLGGYGYGVDSQGFLAGGFGMALLDQSLLSGEAAAVVEIVGGVGGMVVGQRLIDAGRLHIDLSLRLGLGGVASKGSSWEGWAVAYFEPYAELLLAVTPWMALSAQAGYRFMGNLVPGLVFDRIFLRSPALTFAVSWGDFR